MTARSGTSMAEFGSNAAFSRAVSVAYMTPPQPQPTAPSCRRRLYRVTTAGLAVRAGPDVSAARIGRVLRRGDIFEASVAAPGVDGRLYLKLAGQRGWVFDDSQVDPMDPSVQLLTDEETALLTARSSSSGTGARHVAEMQQEGPTSRGAHHMGIGSSPWTPAPAVTTDLPSRSLTPRRPLSIAGATTPLRPPPPSVAWTEERLLAAMSPAAAGWIQHDMQRRPESTSATSLGPPALSDAFREAMGCSVTRRPLQAMAFA